MAQHLLILIFLGFFLPSAAQTHQRSSHKEILPGAYQIEQYLPMLKGKRVGIFANHTSMVGNTHLVDTLRRLGVNIAVIFGPEHGFRGTADAGEKVGNYTDAQSGLPVISLYGAKRKPSKEDLALVDVVVFDIQDVGVRFYTYISSLEELMEATFLNQKPLLILDRPNPNGFYVDGPILQKPAYRSFVGMQPIPVVYGLTIGEYASMLIGERWLSSEASAAIHAPKGDKDWGDFRFKVIPCKNYTHASLYSIPIKPSPNIPDMASVYLYPSTCYFEGTVLSEGRGTPTPFQVFGHPLLPKHLYAFTPVSTAGAKEPKLKDQLCYGWNLAASPDAIRKELDGKIQLKWLLEAYRLFPDSVQFFLIPKSGKPEDHFFNKLVGNASLMEQMKKRMTEKEIRASWEPGLVQYKAIRKKYLIYAE